MKRREGATIIVKFFDLSNFCQHFCCAFDVTFHRLVLLWFQLFVQVAIPSQLFPVCISNTGNKQVKKKKEKKLRKKHFPQSLDSHCYLVDWKKKNSCNNQKKATKERNNGHKGGFLSHLESSSNTAIF